MRISSCAPFLLVVGWTNGFSLAPSSVRNGRSAFLPSSRVTALAMADDDTTTIDQSEDQMLHTAERVAGMSRGEIQHIFEDVDTDGSGDIDMAELDQLMTKYFGKSIKKEDKKALMRDIDSDKNGTIDAEEFYKWMVLNAQSAGTADQNGTKTLQQRQERLDLAHEVPQDLLDLLDEFGTGAVVQKVTHPLHSAFGRTLRDHFVSCYLLSKEWGNDEATNVANMFHAIYQRGDGLRAVDFNEYRPKLQERLGKDVEELLYLFPSAHKSVLDLNGLLMTPVGCDVEVNNVLEGGKVTIPKELRPKLVEMEVINSHDQHVLENSSPVHNLWSFYEHANALPLMSEGAQRAVIEYMKRAPGATCADIVEWQEARFEDAGQEIPELWQNHIALFKPKGFFTCIEENLQDMADEDGNGEICWDEFTSFDWDKLFQCKV
ncbi:expressed unknown protein [Seminavis robusta]|uniref:EF-hand domain-containing protein n=1 Tax=Seminavis robusta TaxID=568900 RepID=A0A9N8EPN7_9STRA|nr:expressed unknown protein [Seminavis robusta]|eukprot:Sro1387_g268360.1 n/a (433) ;mRNA; f:13677-15091